MDETEALNLFISSNFKLLLSSDFSNNLYKSQKSEFFLEKHKDRHRLPKDREIAEHAITYMIKNGIICDEIKLKSILALPFFKENVYNSQRFFEELQIRNCTITIIEPKKLAESKYQNLVRNKIEQEVIRDRKDKIEKAIEQKLEEYNLTPSVLDGPDFVEPIVNEQETNDDATFELWWRRLKLSQDPFPNQVGLKPIDEDLFERIIVKTPIFEKYVYYSNSETSELFKDTIFFGLFGSGKTTLFDYLKKPFSIKKIFTIYIQLYGEQSFQALLTNFRKKLFDSLCEKHRLLFGTDPKSWLETNDYQDGIEKLLDNFCHHSDIIGFIVIIDDLHKDIEAFGLAMKFINNLQIFKGDLVRRIDNLNLAFFVAGSADWETIIKNDSRYSGSYTRQETMPLVTEDDAYEMLNKRLAAFATNPETIRSINLEFVKRIYKGLQNDKLPITFRSFIKATLTEFGNGNFSILTVDPVHISKDILLSIRNILESNPILKKKFSTLLYAGGIQKEENRKRCLELLVLTYLKEGITEDSKELQDNQFGFQRLVKSQLVQKVKLFGGQFKWVISKELREQNDITRKKYNLSLEDYLVKTYISTNPSKAKREPVNEDLKRLDLLSKLITNKEVKALVKAARKTHAQIIDEMKVFERLSDPKSIIDDCIDSLTLLTKSIGKLVGLEITSNNSNLSFLLEFWKDYWVQPGELTEFLNQRITYNVEDSVDHVWYVCSLYRDAFFILVNILEDERDKTKFMVIPFSGLSNEEIIKLRNIREEWGKHQFNKSSEMTTKFVELKLRKFLFNFFTLLFGEQSDRIRNLDSTNRDYILEYIKNVPKKPISTMNEFDLIPKSGYRNFIVGYGSTLGKQNWEQIFKQALSPLSESNLKTFLDVFSTINESKQQSKENSINTEYQNEIFSYIIRSVDLTKRINSAYRSAIEKSFFSIETGGMPRFKNYFSFNSLGDRIRLSPIFIKPSNADRVVEQLTREKPIISFDMEDTQSIESSYGVSYREFVTIIARLIKQTQEESRKTGIIVELRKNKGTIFTIDVKVTNSNNI